MCIAFMERIPKSHAKGMNIKSGNNNNKKYLRARNTNTRVSLAGYRAEGTAPWRGQQPWLQKCPWRWARVRLVNSRLLRGCWESWRAGRGSAGGPEGYRGGRVRVWQLWGQRETTNNRYIWKEANDSSQCKPHLKEACEDQMPSCR